METAMVTLYVMVLLTVDDEVLLVRRKHETFGNGLYSLVGGQVEPNERALHAIARETYEETGLQIPESQFFLMHVLHRKGTEGPFIGLCYHVDITGMNPKNKEPEKHDDMRMFNIHALPKNILPAHKQVLDLIQHNITYSEHGW